MHDQTQVFVPVSLLHGSPGSNLALYVLWLKTTTLVFAIHLQYSVFTEDRKSIKLGLQATLRLRGQDQIISEQDEHHCLPSKAWPIWVPMQIWSLPCQEGIKRIKI